MKKTQKYFINKLTETIKRIEDGRDYPPEGLLEQDQQFLDMLHFTFDMLARTDFNLNTIENDEATLPITHNPIVDFSFEAAQNKPIDLRKLLKGAMTTQREAAKLVSVRPATISDFMRGVTAFNCDNYEIILNDFITSPK